jgi:hypothetical protein
MFRDGTVSTREAELERVATERFRIQATGRRERAAVSLDRLDQQV